MHLRMRTVFPAILGALLLAAAPAGAQQQQQQKPEAGKAAESKAPQKKDIGVNEPGVNRKAPITVNEEGLEGTGERAKKRASDKNKKGGSNDLPPPDDPARKQAPPKK